MIRRPPRSTQSRSSAASDVYKRQALITGVLGIPPDPRLIEVLGWFAFLIPVTLFVYWPNARRPKGAQGAWVQFGTAIALGLTALLLAFGYPRPSASEQMPLNLVTISDTAPQQTGTAELLRQNGAQIVSISLDGETPRTIVLDPDASTVQFRDGVDASAWVITETQVQDETCLLYTSPSPRDRTRSRMPSSA